jgi:hypothetical protein
LKKILVDANDDQNFNEFIKNICHPILFKLLSECCLQKLFLWVALKHFAPYLGRGCLSDLVPSQRQGATKFECANCTKENDYKKANLRHQSENTKKSLLL